MRFIDGKSVNCVSNMSLWLGNGSKVKIKVLHRYEETHRFPFYFDVVYENTKTKGLI